MLTVYCARHTAGVLQPEARGLSSAMCVTLLQAHTINAAHQMCGIGSKGGHNEHSVMHSRTICAAPKAQRRAGKGTARPSGLPERPCFGCRGCSARISLPIAIQQQVLCLRLDCVLPCQVLLSASLHEDNRINASAQCIMFSQFSSASIRYFAILLLIYSLMRPIYVTDHVKHCPEM